MRHTATLTRREAPAELHPDFALSETRADFGIEANLPAMESFLMRDCGLPEELEENWWEYDCEREVQTPRHKLIGHSDTIQGDMELQSQPVGHGLYCGNSDVCQDPRFAELEPGAAGWRLLLQLDSDDDWSACGRLICGYGNRIWPHAVSTAVG